jgi:hypothetical protein
MHSVAVCRPFEKATRVAAVALALALPARGFATEPEACLDSTRDTEVPADEFLAALRIETRKAGLT